MNPTILKKLCSLFAVLLILTAFSAFALGSSDSDNSNDDQGNASAEKDKDNLGDYNIDIVSCRLATDYEGKPVVIVKYAFTNNDDNPQNFMFAVSAEVFQNGIGLNEAYFVDDSANYSSDNQTKDIKKGATLEVEVAYTLNDTTTDIEVEVSELISFSSKKVTKTFSIK